MNTQSTLWQKLSLHQKTLSNTHMREQFTINSQRFNQMHEKLNGMLFDYSKNRINETTLDLLCQLANTMQLKQHMEAMQQGNKINTSEDRAVLHTALRLPSSANPIIVDEENILTKIHHELDRTLAFAESIINGTHLGATGKRITDWVHIGIGGSDIGPQLAVQALSPYHKKVRIHFVNNSDDANIAQVLAPLNPENTAFSIASKSFSTPETLLNAHAARAWFKEHNLPEAGIARHFVAISSDVVAAQNFGIPANHVFAMFDWVGGRYSVWSPIGLPVMIAIGERKFREFLNGAHAMDHHFFNTEFRHNIPVLMALLHIWYTNFYDSDGLAIAPYSHNLRRLPSWLNQLDMESCGKSRTIDGQTINYTTGGIVFGEEGVNCQHAFFQLLHQGTRLIPCDFIVPMNTPYKIGRQHRFSVANAFAQSEALMQGKTKEEAYAELASLSESQRNQLAPHKEFPGNRPSNSILIDELTPFNLGMLMAMYEHKVFTQGVLWNINPFDQWGVEYGKVLAKTIEPELSSTHELKHNSSTNGLIHFYRTHHSR